MLHTDFYFLYAEDILSQIFKTKISGSLTAVNRNLPTLAFLFKQGSAEIFCNLKSESQSSLSGLMNTHISLSYHGQTTAFVDGYFPLTREKIVFHLSEAVEITMPQRCGAEAWNRGFHKLRRMWMCCKVGKKKALADISGSEAGQRPFVQGSFSVTRSTLKCKSSRCTMFIEYFQFYFCWEGTFYLKPWRSLWQVIPVVRKLQEDSEAVSRMDFPSFGVEPCAFMWSVKAMNISD